MKIGDKETLKEHGRLRYRSSEGDEAFIMSEEGLLRQLRLKRK